jgi:hypothetical protein
MAGAVSKEIRKSWMGLLDSFNSMHPGRGYLSGATNIIWCSSIFETCLVVAIDKQNTVWSLEGMEMLMT